MCHGFSVTTLDFLAAMLAELRSIPNWWSPPALLHRPRQDKPLRRSNSAVYANGYRCNCNNKFASKDEKARRRSSGDFSHYRHVSMSNNHVTQCHATVNIQPYERPPATHNPLLHLQKDLQPDPTSNRSTHSTGLNVRGFQKEVFSLFDYHNFVYPTSDS